MSLPVDPLLDPTRRVAIRRAQEDDLERLAQLIQHAFAEAALLYTPQAFAATTPDVAELRTRMKAGPMWVAEDNGKLVGAISAEVRSRDLHIRTLAVHPSARGRRIGRLLLGEAEDHARHASLVRTTLWTALFLRSALALYHAAGYHDTGERRSLHGTPLLAMAKSLPVTRQAHPTASQ